MSAATRDFYIAQAAALRAMLLAALECAPRNYRGLTVADIRAAVAHAERMAEMCEQRTVDHA